MPITGHRSTSRKLNFPGECYVMENRQVVNMSCHDALQKGKALLEQGKE